MIRTDSFVITQGNNCEFKKTESFIIKEDRPIESPKSQEKEIQEAVKSAMLLVSRSGKEILVEV